MTPRPSAAFGVDRRRLLTAGASAALAVGALALPESAEAATESQTGWRLCVKCRGLFAGEGTDSAGVCPAGGAHKPLKTNNYVLYYRRNTDPDRALFTDPSMAIGYSCRTCRSLFRFASDETVEDRGETVGSASIRFGSGVCPAGGAHLIKLGRSSYKVYALWAGTALPFMDAGWDQCSKCDGVFNWADGNSGVCPAEGEHARRGDVYALVFLS